MRTAHLKIKIKSLAAEARFIRHEERKTRGELRESLREHRLLVVRFEARHSLLAYAFLRGKPYRTVEATCHAPPDLRHVSKIAQRFSGFAQPVNRLHNEIESWAATAERTTLPEATTAPPPPS